MEERIKKIKRKISMLSILIVGIISLSALSANYYDDITINTASSTLSNKKIGWDIVRLKNYVIYLKFMLNWASCVSSGNPVCVAHYENMSCLFLVFLFPHHSHTGSYLGLT